jgi:hypothetical protein
MENSQPKSRILSFEDFVSQGLDNQPSADANIHMDQPHGHMELPAPAQEPMGHEQQPMEPNLMMMDEPVNTETEVETGAQDDQAETGEEATDANDVQDNDGQNPDLM